MKHLKKKLNGDNYNSNDFTEKYKISLESLQNK